MSNETYRQFDPWRPSPVKEISRRQIVETHYFNVDHVSYESNQIGSFERYFVQENNGDTVAVLAVTDDNNAAVQKELSSILALGEPETAPAEKPAAPAAPAEKPETKAE